MNNTQREQQTEQKADGSRVFADPVAYLASFDIQSELVEIQSLPAAA